MANEQRKATSSQSPRRDASVLTAFDNLNLHERPSSTPATKCISNSRSSQLSLLTPPSSSGAGAHTLKSAPANVGPDAQARQIFISAQVGDDVFGSTQSMNQFQQCTPAQDGAEPIQIRSPDARYAPREDRLQTQLTASNAQGILPPDACVFVANLSLARTDEQLEESCHKVFDQFGACVIKVRRDKHRHPFALVQFHTIQDANNAIEGGRELVVDGRKIRTEHAQARRSVVLSRTGGGTVTLEEARDLLQRYGPIERMYPTNYQDATLHGIPEGMWVQFAYYLDYKDAAFNNTTTLFKLHDPPALEPRIRNTQGGDQVFQGFRVPRSTTDQKSIFLGNLPTEVTEEDLSQIFQQYGTIKGVNVIRKPVHGGHGYNVFGFIEFSNVSEAEAAAEVEIDLHGQRIRVEPKEYSARRHNRLQPYHPSEPFFGPRNSRYTKWPSHSTHAHFLANPNYLMHAPINCYHNHPNAAAFAQMGYGWGGPHRQTPAQLIFTGDANMQARAWQTYYNGFHQSHDTELEEHHHLHR